MYTCFAVYALMAVCVFFITQYLALVYNAILYTMYYDLLYSLIMYGMEGYALDPHISIDEANKIYRTEKNIVSLFIFTRDYVLLK